VTKKQQSVKRADLDIEKNPHIPDGKRAEDGRRDVSVGPQRKHDTPRYNDESRLHVLSSGVPREGASEDDLGVKMGPGTAPIEGAGTDPNNPNDVPDDADDHAVADSRARVGKGD
jgi:hypothetical protein